MQLGLLANQGSRRLVLSIAVTALLGGGVIAFAQTPPAPTPAAPAPAKSAPAAPAKAAPVANAPAGASQADIDLIKQLRAGGLAIVMRHAPADPDKADTAPLDFKNPRTQQPLTDAGRLASRTFGDALRAIGVPITEVLTSRYQRAIQTVQLAGFKDVRPVTELTEGSLVTSPNEQRRRASALKQLLAAPITTGTNRLLVSHRMNLMQAFGKEWFEVKEGEASIFRIDNGAYTLLARLQMTDWSRLVLVAQPPQN